MRKIFVLFILHVTVLQSVFIVKAAETPSLEAKGAVLMEYDTGRVLFEKDGDKPFANASTTKIMTAIIALEKSALTDVVTASKKAAQTPPVKMYLNEGERQTMEDLLYALMLESANDAAVAIAEHVGGSVENFAEIMNNKARELGAVNTLFVTPNGLDSGDHHTTARDMALIARYALSNKDFRRIIATPAITTPVKGGDFKSHSFVNKDRLLSEYSGAIGIKTGYTGKAGHCFVGAAKRNGMLIISVVLGSGWGARGKEQKWIDTKRLLDYGFNNFEYMNIVDEGTLIKEMDVAYSKGRSVSLILKNGLSLPLTNQEKDKVIIRYSVPEVLEAPVLKGQRLGSADVTINGKSQGIIDIVASENIVRYDLNISMGKIFENWLNMDLETILE